MPRMRPVSHEDRLTLVEHLDELRTRLIISVVTLRRSRSGSASGRTTCIFDLLNEPLPDGREPLTLGVDRALHHDGDRLGLRGDPALAAGDPLPALRVRAAGLQPARAAGRAAAAADGARSCSPAASCSATSWCCRRPSTSCSTSTTTEFNIQIRAREYYSFVALTLVGDRGRCSRYRS